MEAVTLETMQNVVPLKLGNKWHVTVGRESKIDYCFGFDNERDSRKFFNLIKYLNFDNGNNKVVLCLVNSKGDPVSAYEFDYNINKIKKDE